MRKIKLLLVICSLFLASSIKSQVLTYKGLYLDSFNTIVGDLIKEDSLLNYLKDSAYNAIICYNISSTISSDQTSLKNKNLASFIKRARTSYGIKYVMASSESYNTHLTLSIPYNRSRLDTNERFTHFYLEFEFWNKNNTASGGYYCTTYLYPKGYTCDTSGAFKYYKKMAISLDSLASTINCKSATYVGSPNAGQSKFIASTFDFILCDNYTSNTANIYFDVKTNFSNFGSTSKTVNIVPIFASYSPGGIFLGDYLKAHSESSIYNSLFFPRYSAETGTWKSKINLMGYQWYRYSGMPHNGNYNCKTPYSLTITSISNNSATISWLSDNTNDYMFKYRAVGDLNWTSISTVNKFYILSGLSSGASYEACVGSICNPPSDLLSTVLRFTTIGCKIPDGFVALSTTNNSFDIKWNRITGSTGYNVQYRTLGESLWKTTSTLTNSCSLTGLLSSMNYEIRIQSICGSILSDYSTICIVKTLNVACQLPTNINAISPTTTSLSFNWVAYSSALSYNFNIRKKGSSSWTVFSTVDVFKNLSSLSTASTYEYQLQSVCADGNSLYSNIASAKTATNTTNCIIPSGIFIDNITSTSADVNFNIVNGSTSYTIQYRKFGNTKWSSLTTYFLKKTISSLSSLTKYEVKVKSNCSGNNGVYSQIYTFTTK